MAEAQNSGDMLSVGREWVYKESVPDDTRLTDEEIFSGVVLPYKISYHSLLVGKSTSFDGKECYEILHRYDNTEQVFGYAYEEEGKLYYYALYSGIVDGFSQPLNFINDQWHLLYNWKSEVGVPSDMFWMSSWYSLGGVDTISVNSRNFVRQTWRHVYDDGRSVSQPVVEGIGCETGFLYILNITTNGASTLFVECRENGECIFTADDFNVAPVIDGITTVQTSPRTVTPLYDLQGRLRHNKSRRGLYVENGRIVLAK